MVVLVSVALALVPFWLLTLLKAVRAGRRTPDWVTADDEAPAISAKVSVLIAARDEERNIGPCVDSLLAQSHADLEVIVVDDRSEDRTSEVAARGDPRITVIRADDLPEGWCGKPHALHLGAARATGEWLLLTDADTIHRPTSVANGLAFAAKRDADVVSTVGEMRQPTLIANLVTPQIYAVLAAVAAKERRAHPIGSTACGGYFLMTRAAYERAGGIASVKDALDEDRAFGERLEAAGARYAFGVGAPALWKTESYGSLRAIDRGFARNRALRLRTGPLIGMSILILVLGLVPIATLIGTLATRELWIAGVVQYAIVLAVQAYVRAMSRAKPYLAPLAPIGALIAWVLLVRWSVRKRPVEWKGRTYQ